MAPAIDKLKEIEQLVTGTKRRTASLITAGMQYAQTGDISRLEKTTSLLLDAIRNPQLPRSLINEIQGEVRELHLIGYRYFIDSSLTKARHAAQRHDDKGRNAYLKLARDYLPKAISAGAGEEFRRDAARLIEIIQLTGTAITPSEGTIAKPIDRAPPMVNRAKGC